MTRAELAKLAHAVGSSQDLRWWRGALVRLSSRVLFVAFMAYERIANSTERVAFLRSNIFVVLASLLEGRF